MISEGDSDTSESHYYWHKLVHFTSGKIASWKTKAWRHKIKFASKKIHFLGSRCWLLVCSDGQHPLRGGPGGKATLSHYQRQPIPDHHRHKRSKECSAIRNFISAKNLCHLVWIRRCIGMLTNNRIRKIVNVIVVAFGLIHVNLKPTPSQAKKSKEGPTFLLCFCVWRDAWGFTKTLV